MAALIMYAALSIWTTWPLVLAPASTLPTRTTGCATVPLFNLWTVWWNSDRALHGFQGYWDAPIFAPTEDTFAFSEPQPATLLVAPVIWLTGSRGLASNLYLWGSLILNAVFAERLLRATGLRRFWPVAGGALILLLPLVHWQIDVQQLVPLWGILWTWTALRNFTRHPGRRSGFGVGAAVGVSFLLSAHQALMLVLLLSASVWLLPFAWRSRGTWAGGLVAVSVGAAIILPFAIPMRQAAERHGFHRSARTVERLSARPADYLAVPGRSLLPTAVRAERPDWRLSAGWIRTGLAVAGLAIGLSRRRWRRWSLFLGANAGLAFLLSLGPGLNLGGWCPWWTLADLVPGVDQVRSVFRFAFFYQLAVIRR